MAIFSINMRWVEFESQDSEELSGGGPLRAHYFLYATRDERAYCAFVLYFCRRSRDVDSSKLAIALIGDFVCRFRVKEANIKEPEL